MPTNDKPKPSRPGRLSVGIDPTIKAAVLHYMAWMEAEHGLRLTVTQLVEQGLVKVLKDVGRWPPKPKKRRGKP